MSFIMGKVAAVFGEVACWRHGCEGLRAGRPSGSWPTLTLAEARLHEWYHRARRSRIPEIKKAALTVQEHFQELLASSRTHFFSASAEALNGLIQTAKGKFCGFHSPCHFRAIIFLLGGNLHFNLPDPFPPPLLHPQ
jgi:hypothetical protein